MKLWKTAPVLVALAFGAVAGGALIMTQRAATADTAAASTAARSDAQADASALRTPAICEDREVDMDEGYGLTRKETRRVCR